VLGKFPSLFLVVYRLEAVEWGVTSVLDNTLPFVDRVAPRSRLMSSVPALDIDFLFSSA
jgi:hypothetical protein